MATSRGCTQCGACVNTCPVFRLTRREDYSPKAKQEILDFAERSGSGLDPEKAVNLAGRCVCCERCLTACARNLSVPDALGRARQRNPKLSQYFWREWVKRGDVIWKIAAKAAPLAPRALLPEKLRILHASALAMTPPGKVKPWLRLEGGGEVVKGERVVVFGGCTATRLRPVWMNAVNGILEKLGMNRLSASGFTCCGGTYEHAGMIKSAVEAAEKNLHWWRELGKPRVVTFCASCMHSLRHYAKMPQLGEILTEQEAEEWLESLTPLSTLLSQANVVPTGDAPFTVAYHSPCHWGASDPDLAWLKTVLPGLKKGASLCCGFGGVMKLMEPVLSADLAAACWSGMEEAVGGSAPLKALTGCSGCAMQLAGHAPEKDGTKHEIRHWLDCIAW